MGPQDASDRIWLKQSVQFSVAGQVRTIEIALPVRPGASTEEIERLLRQADAGLDQMTQHLNSKVSELLDQAKKPTSPEPAASPRRAPRSSEAEGLAAPGERARASGPSASVGAQPGRAGGSPAGAGWSPSEPGAAAGPALDRKQFIAEIAVLGLNPRQAMERLGLRTLDGVNLRQALEQLRLQLLHERPPDAGELAAQVEDSGGSLSAGPPPRGAAPPRGGAPPRRPAPELKHVSPLSQGGPVEPVGLRPLTEGDLVLDDEEPLPTDAAASERQPLSGRDHAPLPIPIRGQRMLRSLQEQVQAQTLLERLRGIRGRQTPPSTDNLKAFRYVVVDQIGAEKTAALLQAVWNVPSPERLSPDQVAECIRWGHDDDFEEQVDLLLKLTAPEES